VNMCPTTSERYFSELVMLLHSHTNGPIQTRGGFKTSGTTATSTPVPGLSPDFWLHFEELGNSPNFRPSSPAPRGFPTWGPSRQEPSRLAGNEIVPPTSSRYLVLDFPPLQHHYDTSTSTQKKKIKNSFPGRPVLLQWTNAPMPRSWQTSQKSFAC
jgi:hypothetical protein